MYRSKATSFAFAALLIMGLGTSTAGAQDAAWQERDYNPKADEGYHSPVWHDALSSQYTCVQYRTGVNTQTGVGWCEAYGRDERYRNYGKTAAEACCAAWAELVGGARPGPGAAARTRGRGGGRGDAQLLDGGRCQLDALIEDRREAVAHDFAQHVRELRRRCGYDDALEVRAQLVAETGESFVDILVDCLWLNVAQQRLDGRAEPALRLVEELFHCELRGEVVAGFPTQVLALCRFPGLASSRGECASDGLLSTPRRVTVSLAFIRSPMEGDTQCMTQPQDYDQVTWLAGLGARLAVVPANFSREMRALPALLAAARVQIRDEPAKRATGDNRARVRNATALLADFEPRGR